MRILQLAQKPQRRGAEVFASQLSRELARQDHEVKTAYLYPYQGANQIPLREGDFVLAGRELHPAEKFPGFDPRLLRQLVKLIGDFQPDVVQVNGARTVKYGALASRFQPQGGWALIYRNIGNPQDWLRSHSRRLFYKQLVAPRLNGVVGVSHSTLNSLKEMYALRVPAARIPNGVDPAILNPTAPRDGFRERMKTPARAPVILFIGSLSVEKRLDRLLRAAAKVANRLPDLRVWVVGDGPLRNDLEEQAASLGLAGVAQFFGSCPDVADFMQAADLLVLTSDTEGIPAVILEAGLLGLPVVATRVGGIPECVVDGETGILAEPDDEAAIERALLELLEQPRRRQEMGERAKEWVGANFTIDRIADQYVSFYQQVIEHCGKVCHR